MLDAGVIVIGAFISPLHKNRELIKETVGGDRYFEVFIDTPLEICEQRDTKGLYKKARSGELKNFTGIDAPYERPTRPDATILTTRFSPEESANLLLKAIEPRLKFS
jgi:adenylylsulfate kinase-like enzyme